MLCAACPHPAPQPGKAAKYITAFNEGYEAGIGPQRDPGAHGVAQEDPALQSCRGRGEKLMAMKSKRVRERRVQQIVVGW